VTSARKALAAIEKEAALVPCDLGSSRSASFLEQVGVRPGAHEDQGVAVPAVDQQEVAANVAFAVIGPAALERLVQPFTLNPAVTPPLPALLEA
jgi:hypothetical protein